MQGRNENICDCIMPKKAQNAFLKMLQYILATAFWLAPFSQTHLLRNEKTRFQLLFFEVQDVARQAY